MMSFCVLSKVFQGLNSLLKRFGTVLHFFLQGTPPQWFETLEINEARCAIWHPYLEQ